MLYRNMLFLAVGFVSTGILMCPLMAAPTVKKLGVSTPSNIQNAKVTQQKTSTSGQRAPSVRLLGTSAKPVTKPVSTTNIANVAPSTTGATDSARLSGLHGSLVKGISSKISPNYSPQPNINTSDLTKRVIALEEQMGTKQVVLEPGDGITIDGKTISLSEEIIALPEKMAEIDQEITTLNEKTGTPNLSSDYYTIDQTQEYLQQNYYTKTYVDQIISQLSNSKVVSHFDPGFLTKEQTQEP